MKTRFTLLTLAIFVILTGYSQNFIDENKQWNVIYETGMPDITITQIYTIEGDTVINDLMYQQLWESKDSLSTRFIKGFLREANKQVFYLSASGYTKTYTEGLLYDFNLQVGDTTTIANDFGVVDIVVWDIDTIEYAGVPHKRWKVANRDGGNPDYWIEDVGSVNGLIYSLFWEVIVCPSWQLSCCYQNDELVYKNPHYAACYIEEGLGVENNTDNLYINLSPNPVQQGNSFYIANTLQVQHIAIYTISGQLVKEMPVSDNVKIEISTQDMLKGLYLVRLTTKNDKILTQKLLVQ